MQKNNRGFALLEFFIAVAIICTMAIIAISAIEHSRAVTRFESTFGFSPAGVTDDQKKVFEKVVFTKVAELGNAAQEATSQLIELRKLPPAETAEEGKARIIKIKGAEAKENTAHEIYTQARRDAKYLGFLDKN